MADMHTASAAQVRNAMYTLYEQVSGNYMAQRLLTEVSVDSNTCTNKDHGPSVCLCSHMPWEIRNTLRIMNPAQLWALLDKLENPEPSLLAWELEEALESLIPKILADEEKTPISPSDSYKAVAKYWAEKGH